MPRPSLDLAVEITTANGTQHRWGPGRRAEEIPTGLSFRTKQAEGFADANVSLARRIDRDYIDLHLLDSVVIAGASGDIAYEGRVTALPRSMQDTHQIAVQMAGWMAHARDRKMTEVYVDRDLGGWGDMPLNRKAAHATASRSFGDFSFTGDQSAVVAALPNQALGAQTIAETWYLLPPGLNAASVDYNGTAVSLPAGWITRIDAAADDAAATEDSYTPTLDGTSHAVDLTTPRPYLIVRVYSNGTAATPAAGASVRFGALAVWGDHTVPRALATSGYDGVYASDVINDIVTRFCPKLNTAGVLSTTYPIPHLTFPDRIDPYDAILEVNKHHLWQFGVYEHRTMRYGPVDMSDYDWEIRLTDPGVKVDLQGDSTDTLANGIVVSYTNVTTGRPDVLTPDDHAELKDPGDANPATLANLNIWTEISLSSPTTQDAALQIGRAALAEYNQPKAPGTISATGHIRDRAGHWQPVWKVRASDRIIIADHANDRPRLVVETDYQHDSKTISIAVDSTFKRLDAVLDRLGTALRAANLAA
jgi:hypothetical protein